MQRLGKTYIDPRAAVVFRKEYRDMLARGMSVRDAAHSLCVSTDTIRADIVRHPLTEPVPDVDGLLTVKEIALKLGLNYAAVHAKFTKHNIRPEFIYCTTGWFRPEVMDLFEAKPARQEQTAPDGEYDDLRKLATNDLTRKIYEFEHGAKLEEIMNRQEKGMLPATADRELAAFRGSLEAGDFRRFQQLIQFRVAVFKARSLYEEAR